jgi:tetratricopeptide (TPR) repeat protein
LLASGATLVPIVRTAYTMPQSVTSIRLDASAGLSLPAPAHVEQHLSGDEARAYHLAVENLTPDARDRGLRAFWRSRYNFITPTAVSARYDDKTGEETLSLDGTAMMDWSDGRYETDGMGIGYAADFTREPGPHRDAPFAVAFPSYDQYRETIILPYKGEGFTLDTPSFDGTLAGIHYHRTGSLSDGVVTLEETERAVTPEISFAEATAAQAELRARAKLGLFVRRPSYYPPTKGEMADLDAKTPANATEYMTRAMARYARWIMDGAIEDFSKVIALDPKNVRALAERASCYAQMHKNDLALADIQTALALDPRNGIAITARGMVASNTNRYQDAIADFSKALEIFPGDSFTLGRRAMAYDKLNDMEHALADSAAALHGLPHWNDLYLLRANLFLSHGKVDGVATEAKAVAEATPDDPGAHRIAGAIYMGLGRKADAMREFDREIAIKPTPSAYLYRMDARPDQDLADKRADLEAARKLAPTDQGVMVADAKLREKTGDYAGSVTVLTEALTSTPTNSILLLRRGIARVHLGQAALAEQDFETARRNARSAAQLNSMCWAKATENVSLNSALADCDASLAKGKEAPTLDSRGFVLLRLARYDEAILSYDQALALRPEQSSSLYGRAIAEARKGDTAKAEADRAEALKVDPNVSSEYMGYGVAW